MLTLFFPKLFLNLGLLLFLAILIIPESLYAHRLKPAVVTGVFDLQKGTYRFEIRTNMEAILAEIGPEHQDTRDSPNAKQYNTLRELAPEALEKNIRDFANRFVGGIEIHFEGTPSEPTMTTVQVPPVANVKESRASVVTLEGSIPQGAKAFTWAYSRHYGNNVLKLSVAGEEAVFTQWLEEGARSDTYELLWLHADKSFLEITIEYTRLGFTHIVPKGLDHILFVLGIFLLNHKLGPVLWQVTAFTLAHSVTLALSTLGILQVPSSIVEPLIALSIVWVGVENVFTSKLKVWRVGIVFAFGLLHGLGFAGVLGDIGLPPGEFLTALITFNVGVELGQLFVILIGYFMLSYWFGEKSWYRARVIIPASLTIAVIGAYWAVERVLV